MPAVAAPVQEPLAAGTPPAAAAVPHVLPAAAPQMQQAQAAGAAAVPAAPAVPPAPTPEQQTPPPVGPQPVAAVPPRQQLARLLQRCTEAGVLDSKAALLYRFQFGRMPAVRQAEELEILAGLAAEGALAEVASCVRLAVADAAAVAQHD